MATPPRSPRRQAHGGRAAVVQWEGAYRDDDKIQPRARTRDSRGRARAIDTDLFAIQLVDDPEANAATLELIDAIKLAPIRAHESRVLGYLNVVVPTARRTRCRPRRPAGRRVHQHLHRAAEVRRAAGPDRGRQPDARQLPDRTRAISRGCTPRASRRTSSPRRASWWTSADSGVDNGTTTPNHFGLYTLGDTAQASRVVYSRLEGTAEQRQHDPGLRRPRQPERAHHRRLQQPDHASPTPTPRATATGWASARS